MEGMRLLIFVKLFTLTTIELGYYFLAGCF